MRLKKSKKKYFYPLMALVLFSMLSYNILTEYSKNAEPADGTADAADAVSAETEAGKTETAAPASTQAGQDLLAQLQAIAADYPALTVGFQLTNLQTGETISLNEDHVFTSASLYKLYVTYATLTEVDNGTASLTEVMDTSTGETIADYLGQVITVSANEPALSLARKYNWLELDSFVEESGFTSTTFNPYYDETTGEYDRGTLQTTPADVSDLISRLYEGTLLSASSTDYFIGLLEDQQLDYALPTGLEEDVSFAHKTGILDTVSHDAGMITYGGDQYIVTVMSEGWTDAYNEPAQFFLDMGQAIMTYLYAQDTGKTGS